MCVFCNMFVSRFSISAIQYCTRTVRCITSVDVAKTVLKKVNALLDKLACPYLPTKKLRFPVKHNYFT